MKLIVLLVTVSVVTYTHSQSFKCPTKDGLYEDKLQCDKFYECNDGEATAQLCPDGLVFNPTPATRRASQCDQPFNVDCGDRTELQPAQPGKLCPRRNGFFVHPDPSVCNVFYSCVHGEAIKMDCAAGLHFDEISGTCVWPRVAGRTGCNDIKMRKLKDGFECPQEPQSDANGQVVIHPKYPNPKDCQRFYVCLNGDEPRDLGCQTSEVYNEETQKCDAPENVPGCENWYKDEPTDSKPASPRLAGLV